MVNSYSMGHWRYCRNFINHEGDSLSFTSKSTIKENFMINGFIAVSLIPGGRVQLQAGLLKEGMDSSEASE